MFPTRSWTFGFVIVALLPLSACATAGPRPSYAEVPSHSPAGRPAEALDVAATDRLLTGYKSERAKLTLVFVLDGLRPDAISPERTPHLHALRADGVSFTASHSVFPTVTRVNASAIATGRYPSGSGILGNVIYAPLVDAKEPISTGEYAKLRALDAASGQRLLLSASLGELLAQHGKKLAVVSSSGNGCALLLNHRAPEGVGILVNGFLEPGKLVGFPQQVNDAVVARYGHTPLRDEVGPGAVDWAENVLREYVLPELGAE